MVRFSPHLFSYLFVHLIIYFFTHQLYRYIPIQFNFILFRGFSFWELSSRIKDIRIEHLFTWLYSNYWNLLPPDPQKHVHRCRRHVFFLKIRTSPLWCFFGQNTMGVVGPPLRPVSLSNWCPHLFHQSSPRFPIFCGGDTTLPPLPSLGPLFGVPHLRGIIIWVHAT